MGPWYHGAWSIGEAEGLGDIRFGSKTGEFYRDNIEFPFFSHYLKGRGNPKLPEAYVFETGRNLWHKEDSWPPRSARAVSLYFHADGRLSFDAPPDQGFDEYVSDPSKPVPYIEGQAPGDDAPKYDRRSALRGSSSRRVGVPDRPSSIRRDRGGAPCAEPVRYQPREPTRISS